MTDEEKIKILQSKKQKIKRVRTEGGFTLIELLAVITIVGLLSSIIVSEVALARAKGRDAARKAALNQIAQALTLRYDDTGNFIDAGSGCGSSGGGQGWFNYVGGTYPASIASCLMNGNYIPAEIIDPTGGRTSSPTIRYAFMKYTCGSGSTRRASVLAKLETVPQSATAVDGSCCPGCDQSWGMNYYRDAY